MKRLAEERARIAREEEAMRSEALAELERVNEQIDALEERREQLEAFLGLNDTPQRAAHGQITNLCIQTVSQSGRPLSSGEVKEILERENPNMKLTSVPAALSRLVSLGRMTRDQFGRYSLS
jgi:EAL domain-containing protein (putative c-di-GMP-specific phosphodiesterase class I)